jgi:hypothetical protein
MINILIGNIFFKKIVTNEFEFFHSYIYNN